MLAFVRARIIKPGIRLSPLTHQPGPRPLNPPDPNHHSTRSPAPRCSAERGAASSQPCATPTPTDYNPNHHT